MSRLKLASPALLSALVAGCTFAPGEPVGVLELALSARFDASAREGPVVGELRTSTDFLVRVDETRLTLSSLKLSFADEQVEPTFDEAAPPAGYTLCHGGHCHSEDGRLVDYEDVERELRGEPLEPPGDEYEVEPLVTLEAAALEVATDCGACALPATIIDDARLSIERVELSGRVFDSREGEEARLPSAGFPFVIDARVGAVAIAEIDTEVSALLPQGLRLDLDYRLPVGLIDLAWDDALDATAQSAPPSEPVTVGDLTPFFDEVFAFDDAALTARVERF